MGDRDTNGDAIDARRELVERLRAHGDVREVNFSRDGFRVIVVELEPGADFRDRWRRTATGLGYTVERIETGSRPDRPATAWALRLGEEGGTDRPRWRTALRNAMTRARAFVERLLDRSN
jgi:hypothetical protein